MVIGRLLAPLLLGALLLAPSSLRAQPRAGGPAPGGGRIDLGGGWRLAPGALDGASGANTLARFGWQADARFLLAIELGFGWYYQKPPEGTVRVTVGRVRLASTYQILREGPVLPYVALGFGYDLLGASSGGIYRESGSTAYFGGLGVYVPLTPRVGLLIEDRYTFAGTTLEVFGQPKLVSSGGNLLWAAVVFTFLPEKNSLQGS